MSAEQTEQAPRSERLERPTHDRMLGGVCAGFALHTGLPVRSVRIGAVVLTMLGGVGAALYAWLWVTAPQSDSEVNLPPLKSTLTKPAEQERRRLKVPVAELFLGAILVVAGALLALRQIGVDLPLDLILPSLAVVTGIGLAWWQIADSRGDFRRQTIRAVGALVLVALGVLMFFVTAREPNAWTIVAAAFAVLAGVALALAPWLLRLNRDLIAERTGRAREAERSEIAAHLHDSVLQTLALIQQQSPPESEASRLARGQERELREWLFRTEGATVPTDDWAESLLKDHATALEHRYPVRFEVVTVGESVAAPEPILAAAREAMLNAAQHAGGTVTVYVETGRDRIEIEIMDRGPGFDREALPEDRMGVRGSILGRMERAGGTAHIGAGPGRTGTVVRLAIVRHVQEKSEEAVT